MTAPSRIEFLEEAIRDMLDFATGWCGRLTKTERLERIEAIGNDALAQEQDAA